MHSMCRSNDHSKNVRVVFSCTKFTDAVPKELGLTEVCLRENPKSYSAWHQRCWIMKETDFVHVPDELKLCSKYLKLDERNCMYISLSL